MVVNEWRWWWCISVGGGVVEQGGSGWCRGADRVGLRLTVTRTRLCAAAVLTVLARVMRRPR